VSDQFFWFATRGAGILCWFAASASLMAGLLLSTRILGRKPTIPWLLDLHRFLASMGMLFLAVHMVSLWADSFISFGLSELLVPGVANVPGLTELSLTLGVVSAWIMTLVYLSSLIKKKIPASLWHTIHLTSYGVVVAGAVHALQAGSEGSNPVLIAAGASTIAATVILTLLRFVFVMGDRQRRYAADVEEVQAPEPELIPLGASDAAGWYDYGYQPADDEQTQTFNGNGADRGASRPEYDAHLVDQFSSFRYEPDDDTTVTPNYGYEPEPRARPEPVQSQQAEAPLADAWLLNQYQAFDNGAVPSPNHRSAKENGVPAPDRLGPTTNHSGQDDIWSEENHWWER